MLNSADKRDFISVMQYFFDTTGITYPDYQDLLLNWDKYQLRQTESYTYWLFARCLETLNSRNIAGFETCMAYQDTLCLYLDAVDNMQSSFIGDVWLSQARAYLASYCHSPTAICDISGTLQSLYPNLPVLTIDELQTPSYVNQEIIIASNTHTESINKLLSLAETPTKADIYIMLYGVIDTQDALFQEFNKQFSYLNGFTTNDNITVTFFRLQSPTKPNVYILDKLEYCNHKVLNIGKKLLRHSKMSLLKWQMDKSPADRPCPMLVTPIKYAQEQALEPAGTLAHIALSAQAARDATWSPYPIIGYTNLPITTQNYWQSIVSHGIRSVLSFKANSRLDISAIQAPEESLPEYQTFKADSLALMLFGLNAYSYSYRDKQVRNNCFFPLDINTCKKLATDPIILDDMQKHPSDNSLTIQALSWATKNMSQEGLELTQFCLTKLLQSIMGTARFEINYKNGLSAYDAGLAQIRAVPELWSSADNEQYIRLVSQLRSKMTGLIYIFDSSEV